VKSRSTRVLKAKRKTTKVAQSKPGPGTASKRVEPAPRSSVYESWFVSSIVYDLRRALKNSVALHDS
jgi:hypothetical protein